MIFHVHLFIATLTHCISTLQLLDVTGKFTLRKSEAEKVTDGDSQDS